MIARFNLLTFVALVSGLGSNAWSAPTPTPTPPAWEVAGEYYARHTDTLGGPLTPVNSAFIPTLLDLKNCSFRLDVASYAVASDRTLLSGWISFPISLVEEQYLYPDGANSRFTSRQQLLAAIGPLEARRLYQAGIFGIHMYTAYASVPQITYFQINFKKSSATGRVTPYWGVLGRSATPESVPNGFEPLCGTSSGGAPDRANCPIIDPPVGLQYWTPPGPLPATPPYGHLLLMKHCS